jgi:hypothetical protein
MCEPDAGRVADGLDGERGVGVNAFEQQPTQAVPSGALLLFADGLLDEFA